VARWLIPLLCFLLLLALIPPAAAQAQPAPATGSSVPLELGFGPASLNSLDVGVPVYTQGDELWIMNTYNSTSALTLQGPEGGPPSASSALAPETAELLYAFPASAPNGVWTLSSSWSSTANASILVEVADSSPGGVQGSLASATLSASSLSLSYNLSLGSSDDVEAVLTDASLSPEAIIPIPSSLGSGSLGVQISNDSGSVTVTRQGSVSSPFAFWLELYMDYSYSQITTLGYVTSPVLAARSQAVQMSPGLATAQASIDRELVMRQGRYAVRAYFSSGSTISVEETGMLLLEGGGWIWQGLGAEQPVGGAAFGVTADLAKAPWPSYLVVTYRSGGVGSYSVLPLGVTLARVSFVVPPWGATAPDVSITLRPDPSVSGYGVSGGTLFVVGGTDTFDLAYDLALGSHTFLSSTIDVGAGLSATVSMPLGEMDVNSTLDGKPASGANVTASDGLGGSASHVAGVGGDTAFFLPSGSYNVTVVEGNSRSSQTVEVTASQVQRVVFSLSSSTLDLTAPLLALAAFGIALNLWVWVYRPFKRAPKDRAPQSQLGLSPSPPACKIG
jgi:hypothetical protein